MPGVCLRALVDTFAGAIPGTVYELCLSFCRLLPLGGGSVSLPFTPVRIPLMGNAYAQQATRCGAGWPASVTVIKQRAQYGRQKPARSSATSAARPQ